MAELLEEIAIGGGLTKRVYDNGQVQVVDSDGKFIKHPDNVTPSEVAAELSKQGKIRSSKQMKTDVEDLLSELELSSGYDKHLAQIFVKGGTAAIPAAKELIGRSRSQVAQPPPPPPVKGVCPTCGGVVGDTGLAAFANNPIVNAAIARRLASEIDRDLVDMIEDDLEGRFVDSIDIPRQRGDRVDAQHRGDGDGAQHAVVDQDKLEAERNIRERLSIERERIRSQAT